MLRRTFLKLAALAGLVPRPARAEGADPHVVVVGAGPAGFSAALELAERGVRVTLLEADQQVGGKVKGWVERLDGEALDVEHGIHGWWHQYVHFTELLERNGLGQVLREADAAGAFRGKGDEVDANTFSGARTFIARYQRDAAALGYTAFRPALKEGLRWFRSLTPSSAREQIGGLSVAEWHARDAPLSLWRVYQDQLAHSMYFLPPEQIDAAEFALGEAFYNNGAPRNKRVRWLRGNPQTLIWEPLAERFRELGGELRLGTRVTELVISGGRIAGVRTGEPRPGAWLETIDEGWTQLDRGQDIPPVFVGREGDRVQAFSGECTHAGCALELGDEGFLCPCHGGVFDFAGDPVAGPPERPLRPLFVDRGADGWHVEGEGPGELIDADAVILAVDAPALVGLAGSLLPGVDGLQACRETVARFWFDRDLPEDFGHAAIFDGLEHINNGFLVHRLQDAAREWAERTGGSVIEVQAYKDIPQELEREALLDLLLSQVRTAWPELNGATVLKRTLTRDDRFTAFVPGWHAHARPVESSVPGLLLAGDHVDVPERNVAFMERAVYTGRLAANAVLREHGLPQAPILPPATR